MNILVIETSVHGNGVCGGRRLCLAVEEHRTSTTGPGKVSRAAGVLTAIPHRDESLIV